MRHLSIDNKYIKSLISIACVICFIIIFRYNQNEDVLEVMSFEEDEIEDNYTILMQTLFDDRNKFILDGKEENLKSLYETEKKFGLWAYEHEIQKMKYLKNWSKKQGVNFSNIKTKVHIRKVAKKEENLYGVICKVSTEYKYLYENQKDVENMFRIGTYHYLNIKNIDGDWIIVKEWYTDPFADSLNLENIDSDEIKNYIISKQSKSINLTPELEKAVEYAHKYCGAAADEEDGLKFNLEYKDFNPDGGDCANFASQIMFESGRFKKNQTWNYKNQQATKAWVNAQGFKNYLIYSGRGSLIAKGSYSEIYKLAYNLSPGDIVGYEKNGRITHVSTVTGQDSKGYPLVTCHNTDRKLVPWDLGWSNKSIRFHLIKVHY